MLHNDSAEHIAKVRREREITSLEQLFGSEAGPLSVDLAAFHTAARDEQTTGVSVVGAAGSILAHRAPEFRHGEDHDVVHAVAKIMVKSGQAVTEILQPVGKLAAGITLIRVRIPAADVG